VGNRNALAVIAHRGYDVVVPVVVLGRFYPWGFKVQYAGGKTEMLDRSQVRCANNIDELYEWREQS